MPGPFIEEHDSLILCRLGIRELERSNYGKSYSHFERSLQLKYSELASHYLNFITPTGVVKKVLELNKIPVTLRDMFHYAALEFHFSKEFSAEFKEESIWGAIFHINKAICHWKKVTKNIVNLESTDLLSDDEKRFAAAFYIHRANLYIRTILMHSNPHEVQKALPENSPFFDEWKLEYEETPLVASQLIDQVIKDVNSAEFYYELQQIAVCKIKIDLLKGNWEGIKRMLQMLVENGQWKVVVRSLMFVILDYDKYLKKPLPRQTLDHKVTLYETLIAHPNWHKRLKEDEEFQDILKKCTDAKFSNDLLLNGGVVADLVLQFNRNIVYGFEAIEKVLAIQIAEKELNEQKCWIKSIIDTIPEEFSGPIRTFDVTVNNFFEKIASS